MRIPTTLLGLIAAIFLAMPPANAQYQLITIEKPFTARSLSGVVIDSTGAPVPDVVVERCDAIFVQSEVYNGQGQPAGKQMLPDCNRESGHDITKTKTGANGRFAFPDAKSGRTYYLHFSAPGFDPMQIAVKLRFFSRARARIQLEIAT
jgi:hypothetical protein